jgi:hypothetical protein
VADSEAVQLMGYSGGSQNREPELLWGGKEVRLGWAKDLDWSHARRAVVRGKKVGGWGGSQNPPMSSYTHPKA